MNKLDINLKDIKIEGDILDLSVEGNNVLSEILSSAVEEVACTGVDKGYIDWEEKTSEDFSLQYDSAVAFFSLSSTCGKRAYESIIKEAFKMLRYGGKLMIWDMELPMWIGCKEYNLNIEISEKQNIQVPVSLNFNPFRVKYNEVMDTIVKSNFNINKSQIIDNLYYIEAVKLEDTKNEHNVSIT